MDLLPSVDELSIAEATADLLKRELPLEKLRARENEPTAISDEGWAACTEAGLLGLALAENDGGAGFTMIEETLAFREIGRGLAPGPLLSGALAARVTASSGHPELTDEITTGEVKVGFAMPIEDAGFSGGSLEGKFDLMDSVGAEYVLFADPEQAALFRVADFDSVETYKAVDPGTRLAIGTASGMLPVHAIGAAAEPVFLRGTILAAAALAGISEACRDASTRHAKTREQFGRPIGVHQAIKHRCADMAVSAELAFSQLMFASAAVNEERSDAAFEASTAKIIAGKAALENAAGNVQVHGGMGYTYEHDAHLFVKRAAVYERLLGTRVEHLAAVISYEGTPA